MNNSLQRILDGFVTALDEEIIPRLDDAFARGQALAIVDLLRNLSPRLELSHAVLWEQIEAQENVLRRVAEACSTAGVEAPVVFERRFSAEHPAAEELRVWRDELERKICGLLEWLDKFRPQMPETLAGTVRNALQQYMHEQLRRDISLTANPLFAEISRGGSRAAAK